MLSQEELLSLLNKAMSLKGGIIEVSDLGDSILQPQKFTRFVKQMQEDTVILPEARYITMDSQIVDIDRVAFLGRVLKSGEKVEGATTSHRDLETSEFAKPTFSTNQLIAKEFQAIVSLRDKMLRRNIEKEGFEDTLIDMLGEAVGRDSEELYLFADTDMTYDEDDVLSRFDGWIKLAANAVYGAGSNKDFDPEDATFPENMFKAMLDATPKQYLKNRANFRFWVDYETEDAYRDILKARDTALGDVVQTGYSEIAYKGIPVRRAPMLERAKDTEDGGSGRVCLLGYPNNLVWGVFHQITIEPEREAKLRRTDFVLSLEVACNYEDENAATVAYIEKSNPVS
ncbi:MAG: phage major capsid protein [Methanofastidiosum sp.]|jgi:hypothetical protein|nr:phage major capsid protein [Candidatus Izemoplasmatales bacterium]